MNEPLASSLKEDIAGVFRERDALKSALSELCDFIDRATEYELIRAHRYAAYLDARALLQATAGSGSNHD